MSPNTDINYTILAEAASRDDRTRVLKHGESFGLFDHHGDVVPGGMGEQGLYCGGTRFLSRWMVELLGRRPFFLGGNFCDERRELTSSFTNPDLTLASGVKLPLGTIHLQVRTFLWRDCLHQELRLTNHCGALHHLELALHYAADFADIFEVRGMHRAARGNELAPTVESDRAVLAYRGLDDVTRRTVLRFTPPPTRLTDSVARFLIQLSPGDTRTVAVEIACDGSPSQPPR
jgi:glycogen debranching enzyme